MRQSGRTSGLFSYDSPVDMLRVTRVYDGESLLSNLLLAEKLFGLWSADGLDGAKKAYFTFEVFPAADDRNQHAPYASSVLSTSQKDKWTSQLRTIQEERPLFFSFLQSQTNLVHLADAVPQAPPAERCWPVTHYALVGADRRVYPCFASCSSFPATSLGPIDLPLEDLEARRRRLFSRPPLQCRAGCRPSAIFYGSRSREYHGSQIELGLPALDEEDISQPAVVHVSYHDPEHTIGGIGWAVYGLCSAQTKGRRLVYWLSPCMRGESPGEQLHQGGLLRVVKLPFTDASLSSIFGTGPDAANLRARFGELVVEYIRQHFLPSRTPIHLHGCIELPRRASDLRNLGYSVVSTFHMLLSSRTKLLGGDPALVEALRDQERRAIASSDTTTVPSVEMQEELAELCPSRRESIHCIPNGIGEEHFGTPCAQQPDTHRLIVSFGRISPEKGFDLVIQAAKMLIDSLPEGAKSTLRFHVFGNTDFTVEARRLYTEALVAAADGYPGITITATPQGITGPAKLAIIDQAIAGVVPSLYEPFGMVLPEMMARGKPVVATLTAGAKDILKTDRAGKTDFGFAVEPTADSIRGALAWMLDHPSETQIMGQNARKRARDYRWDVAASSFENLYAGRRPGAGDAPGSVLP